jgi:nucleotide-binding universal stress UspA family protein
MQIHTIIVGIDFSSFSEIARMQAFQLAATTGASVVLVHAYEDSDYQDQASWFRKDESFDQLVTRSRVIARDQLASLAKKDAPPGVDVQIEVSDLGPLAALLSAQENHKAELLVVGTHGRTGFRRPTLARIAQRAVRSCPCSVLVARASPHQGPTLARILVPTDFSKSAESALAAACSLVEERGQIHLLHCWLVHFYPTGYHGLYEERFTLQPEMSASIRKTGQELVKKYENIRFQLSFEEKYGNPVQGISESLEARPYDMVIMGSHNRHGVKRLVLGSTAEATVNHANCSVLIVRTT